MRNPPVQVMDVSLAYRLVRNKASTLKEYAIQAFKRRITHEELWAVQGVSVDVAEGEVLAVIGPNGGGKSTLMKMIARVLPPTEGRIVVRGLVAPMIELGAGFNPDLTGYENIVLYGTLLGRNPRLMEERAVEIADWAGVSDFLDVPIRSYSSGMLARLGFSVATDTHPDVLVVDEVLSVGDQAFQKKSMDRMAEMIDEGAAVVFVSHDLDAVERLASRVLWLDSGRVRALGPPDEIVSRYKALA
jgi:ABC-2 type transport system ATP-binding protein